MEISAMFYFEHQKIQSNCIGSRLRFVIRLKTGTASPASMGGTVPERHNPFFLNKTNTSEILAENTERSSSPDAAYIVIVAPAIGLINCEKGKIKRFCRL